MQVADNRCSFTVTCTGTPKNSKTIKPKKKYTVNQVGFDASLRITNENGRNAWYDRKYFKGEIVDIINKKYNGGLFVLGYRPTNERPL